MDTMGDLHGDNPRANESLMSRRPIPDPVRSAQPSGLSLPVERHLSCPICNDLFLDPVTTCCGHSFCKACLNCNAIDNSCPTCKQHLSRIPEVNVVLEGLLQDLHQARLEARGQMAQESAGRPREVVCDVCIGPGARRALKSCLVCLVSYCRAHLEGHDSRNRLRGHRMVAPVENLDDRACPEHGRPLELYCRDSDRCICVLCVEEGREVVSVETEWEEKRGQLNYLEGEFQGGIVRRKNKLKEMRSSLKVSQDHLRSESTDIDGILSSLISYVENAKRHALLPMDERSQAVERQAKEMTEQLNNEIGELKRNISDLRRISDTEDHIDFLQNYPSTKVLEEENNLTEMALDASTSFGTFRSIIKNLMDEILDKLELVTPIELQRIVTFAVDVKLDPSTAHPRLIVSADGKEVQDGGGIQVVPRGAQRFDLYSCVLGRNRLTSGKAYWQVEVGDKLGWDLGVTTVTSQRKGKLVFEPDTNYWVIAHYDGDGYAAMTAPPKKLALKAKPKMVGVFLNYEEGLVSFYDLTSSLHIFSFTACVFSGELCPYFSPHNELDEGRPLVITAV
ncbi:E3 ubiquitin-protein ligase TRIM39-like [Gadus chalcogrammus]|uniref:E3 ubiquitin-protein ligase TRIM39-like n=1 Tax=Gadus chalcogrammus TaxID=1042646 RepID=UPI0024C4DE01|nr:E3 ubiquitin-protein ligase TRIM39-like [Gadus chalcogrammus]